MALDITGALERGLDRVTTRQGAKIVVLYAAAGVAIALLWETVLGRFAAGDGVFGALPADVAADLRDSFTDYQVLLDLPVPVLGLLLGLLAVWLVQQVVRIGAMRWFVEETPGRLAAGLFVRELGWTLLNLIAGTVIYAVAVAAGLVLLVLPGIFLAVALFFFSYRIVVEGDNAIDALVGSWRLTGGERLHLGLLGALFFAMGLLVSMVGSPSVWPSRHLATVVGAAASAAFGVFGIATAADAYRQLQETDEPAVEEPVPDDQAAG